MVVSNTPGRLDENFVIVKEPTYCDTSDDVDHIISYGHLTSSLSKPERICYFEITPISATLCRTDISPDIGAKSI